MRRKRLLWQLFPSYLLITLLSSLAVAWYASRSLRGFYRERTAADLQGRARLALKLLPAPLASAEAAQVDALCKELGSGTSTRLTVILPSGQVLGDSEEDPAAMDNHADRPEVRAALAGRAGSATRYSHTLRKGMMYLAVPVEGEGRIVGVVRTAVPVTSIDEALREVHVKVGLGWVVIAALAAATSWLISRRISRPLEEMRRGAQRYARGDLGHHLPVTGSEEIAGLAETLNEMAVRLDERVQAVVRQRGELEAVLSSMIEGVLAVDAEERLISLNTAAAQLLGVDRGGAPGRNILEVVRNADLQRFVTRALSAGGPLEGDIVLHEGSDRFLQVHGTPLCDAEGRAIGALIVLNDVTRLRQLERVRRDFVANVSHEIRTPVTAIKGFVETLMGGSLRDPGEAERFLGIIARHTDRLNALIEDLLTLARVEEEAERAEVPLAEGPIAEVLRAAVQACGAQAQARRIRIELTGEEGARARINPALLERAVVNLIDNAIKYSEPGGTVQVGVTRTEAGVAITVRDQGCGIAPEHLPRLFERFYRVDTARSRKLGGTGLGLAIVKHIALAHGGRVGVESAPGRGSVFTIHLPRV